MNWYLAIFAFGLGFIVFFPLYNYFWRLVWQNAEEFAPAYKKEHGKDLEKSVTLGGSGLSDNVADSFTYASLTVFIVPLIPHSTVATGVYFLLLWLMK